MVAQWLARNRSKLGLPENSYIVDAEIQDANPIFRFTWNGVLGEISCFKRVNPSSLIIHQSL